MARSTSRRSAGKRNASVSPALRTYLDQSQRPIVILAFLLPAIVFYQISSAAFNRQIVAFRILSDLMQMLGVYGRSVPAMLLVLTLLGWHLFKRDRWQFSLSTLAKMLLESVLMAVPILALCVLSQRLTALAAEGNPHLGASLSVSAGAGLYEELVFRMYLCGLLWLVFDGALAMPKLWSTVLVVAVSAVLFSLYHYLGHESFRWHTFIFRTLAGGYFAGLYMTRGFGITAGSHTIYDVLVLALARA